MKQAISGLLSSKKAIVYIVAVLVIAAIIFGGIDPAHAHDFIDKLFKLTMAYLGGQGLADMGKYAGEAYASARKAIDGRDKDLSAWNERLPEAAEAAQEAAKATEEALSKPELPPPPRTTK